MAAASASGGEIPEERDDGGDAKAQLMERVSEVERRNILD